MNLGLPLAEKLYAAVHQECAEDVYDPVKPLNQAHTCGNENRTHDQRSQDSPEQDLMLVSGRHLEVTENQQKDDIQG